MGNLNLQVIFQLCGGTLAKAMAMHIACTMPTATGHSIHLDDQVDEDITRTKIPVTEGFSRVPEEPGLGFDVDEELLYRYAAIEEEPTPPYIGVVRMSGGHTIYSHGQPHLPRITGQEEGTIRDHQYERWFDDGSEEWAKTHERVGREGWYVE